MLEESRLLLRLRKMSEDIHGVLSHHTGHVRYHDDSERVKKETCLKSLKADMQKLMSEWDDGEPVNR